MFWENKKQVAFYSSRQVTADHYNWHSRLGHCSSIIINLLQAQKWIRVNGKPAISSVCEAELRKSKQLLFASSVHKYERPFNIIHYDLCGPDPIVS